MSHVAPEPPSRRRLDRAVGAVLALIGIAVLIVAVVALHEPQGRQASKASSTSSGSQTSSAEQTTSKASTSRPRTTPSSTTASSGSASVNTSHPIPIVVLNNTTVTGLADTAKARFEQGGWTVSSVGNLTNDILSTCAYYDPSVAANQQAAEQLQQQFPAITRVKEKFAGLPAGPIVVVLTSDYS